MAVMGTMNRSDSLPGGPVLLVRMLQRYVRDTDARVRWEETMAELWEFQS